MLSFKKLLSVCMITVSCTICTATAVAQTTTPDIENKIALIKVAYKNINDNLKRYKLSEKDSEGQSTEGGEIKMYKDKGVVVKAVAIYYGETGQQLDEYYFKEGKLIFVYEKESEYSVPIYQDGSKISKVTEARYYFDNGKMIRWLDNKGKSKPSKQFAEKEAQILAGLTEIK